MSQTQLIPLWAPRFSSQGRKERNCGLHCISMITHLPMAQVRTEVKNGATNYKQLCNALLMFGWDSSYRIEKCKSWLSLPKLCILDLRNGRRGHWVVWHEGAIYDSCSGKWDDIRKFLEVSKLKLHGFMEVYLVQ